MLTTTHINIQRELKAGNTVEYSSDDHALEAQFDNDHFKIWFNGTYVHISRTFKAFEKKLNQLVREYHLSGPTI